MVLKKNYVNWDPVDETVYKRTSYRWKRLEIWCNSRRKRLNQWFFNISKFSQDLLDGLDKLDQWPNKVKTMQKNWIGKSFGCEIEFKTEGNLPVKTIKCFTTRPDTLFGFSFLALSIDHEISNFYKDDKSFLKFKEECSKTGTTEEAIAVGEKIGFKTDLVALNPLNPEQKVPVYFANFVLMDYGFGAFLDVQHMIKEILILQNIILKSKLLLDQLIKKILSKLIKKPTQAQV